MARCRVTVRQGNCGALQAHHDADAEFCGI
jgi:hypothetical protein